MQQAKVTYKGQINLLIPRPFPSSFVKPLTAHCPLFTIPNSLFIQVIYLFMVVPYFSLGSNLRPYLRVFFSSHMCYSDF
jgi:hypothetical protein